MKIRSTSVWLAVTFVPWQFQSIFVPSDFVPCAEWTQYNLVNQALLKGEPLPLLQVLLFLYFDLQAIYIAQKFAAFFFEKQPANAETMLVFDPIESINWSRIPNWFTLILASFCMLSIKAGKDRRCFERGRKKNHSVTSAAFDNPPPKINVCTLRTGQHWTCHGKALLGVLVLTKTVPLN